MLPEFMNRYLTMLGRDNVSISKSESLGDGARERVLEKTAPLRAGDGVDDVVNVGLHEFALAKQAGLRVSPEESKR